MYHINAIEKFKKDLASSSSCRRSHWRTDEGEFYYHVRSSARCLRNDQLIGQIMNPATRVPMMSGSWNARNETYSCLIFTSSLEYWISRELCGCRHLKRLDDEDWWFPFNPLCNGKPVLEHSIVGKARESGTSRESPRLPAKCEKARHVDDETLWWWARYSLRAQPIFDAFDAIEKRTRAWPTYPAGRTLINVTEELAQEIWIIYL